MNIEVSAAVAADVTANTPAPVAYQQQPIPNPSLTPDAAFRNRYGISSGRPGEGGGEANMRARYGTGPGKFPTPAPTPVQPVLTQPAAPVRTGLPTVIDEKQLKVTLMVNVIKLSTPPATAPVTRTAARL